MKKTIILLFLFCCFAISATRYVRATGGSDGNDGSSFANGWATLQYAFSASNGNRVAPGDTLAICGDTSSNVFDLSTSVNIECASAASLASPILLIGYDASGNIHTGYNRTKITTTSALSSGLLSFSSETTSRNIYLNNLDLDGGGSGYADYCMRSVSSDDCEGTKISKCLIHNASIHGIYWRSPANIWDGLTIVSCEIYENGKSGSGYGFSSSNNTRGNFYMENSSVHDNASGGIRAGSALTIKSSIIYGNNGIGFESYSNSVLPIIENSVFFGNAGDGIELNIDNRAFFVCNNIISNNGGYGINFNGADADVMYGGFIDYNCFYNNTSGDIDINSGIPIGDGNITGSDPKFVSTTDGSEDFSLQSDSPCLVSGIGYGNTTNIGPWQNDTASAPGGSGIFIIKPRRYGN